MKLWRRIYTPAFRAFCASLLLVPALCINATAQTAVISGVVTDSSGAVMMGVSVGLQDLKSATSRRSTTDEVGRYRFEGLAGGSYELTFQVAEKLMETTNSAGEGGI